MLKLRYIRPQAASRHQSRRNKGERSFLDRNDYIIGVNVLVRSSQKFRHLILKLAKQRQRHMAWTDLHIVDAVAEGESEGVCRAHMFDSSPTILIR